MNKSFFKTLWENKDVELVAQGLAYSDLSAPVIQVYKDEAGRYWKLNFGHVDVPSVRTGEFEITQVYPTTKTIVEYVEE